MGDTGILGAASQNKTVIVQPWEVKLSLSNCSDKYAAPLC